MKHEIDTLFDLAERLFDALGEDQIVWCSESRLQAISSLSRGLKTALRPSPKRRFTDSPREERRKPKTRVLDQDRIDELLGFTEKVEGAPYGAKEIKPSDTWTAHTAFKQATHFVHRRYDDNGISASHIHLRKGDPA